ncbi:hypothetical protein TNCV_284581 [Trichonephila clavipes]|uniref:Uncharacterized protein n=1 Tax=Trichonephila clavipes TaxID=2585209 RepID=A0A8X6SJ38_TRICX|nr:hypothetical protein TNCV_284581 [Trichonephila clavipes]
MIWLGSTPILWVNTLENDQEPPIYISLPPTSQEDLQLEDYLEYPHVVKTPSFTSIHAFSGIRTRPYGKAVIFNNDFI